MRSNGVDLVPRLLTAEVRKHRQVPPEDWTRYGKLMPLPDLFPEVESAQRHQAAFFDSLHLVAPGLLVRRTACLSQRGVNLLLQGWVHHNSRVVIPTATYNQVTGGVYEEADLIEEWCFERGLAGVSVADSTAECVSWLRQDGGGGMRQKLLEDEQNRSTIRRQMRTALIDLSRRASIIG
jgi:hypothetical protein